MSHGVSLGTENCRVTKASLNATDPSLLINVAFLTRELSLIPQKMYILPASEQ